MCIISAKAKGVNMPTRDRLKTMFDHNPHGAGIMWADGETVHIEKGFMKFADFMACLDLIAETRDLRDTAIVMHFRITTHGGTRPENTHPFPCSDSLDELKKLSNTTHLGIAHNGIIPIKPRSADISDTMEFISAVIAPMDADAMHKPWYADKTIQDAVVRVIQSRMCFLTPAGEIFTIGNGWHFADDGVQYSNTSYQAYDYSRFNAHAELSPSSGRSWLALQPKAKQGKKAKHVKSVRQTAVPTERELMWVCAHNADAYVVDTYTGCTYEGMDFAMDKRRRVYEYDVLRDLWEYRPRLMAMADEYCPLAWQSRFANFERVAI